MRDSVRDVASRRNLSEGDSSIFYYWVFTTVFNISKPICSSFLSMKLKAAQLREIPEHRIVSRCVRLHQFIPVSNFYWLNKSTAAYMAGVSHHILLLLSMQNMVGWLQRRCLADIRLK